MHTHVKTWTGPAVVWSTLHLFYTESQECHSVLLRYPPSSALRLIGLLYRASVLRPSSLWRPSEDRTEPGWAAASIVKGSSKFCEGCFYAC